MRSAQNNNRCPSEQSKSHLEKYRKKHLFSRPYLDNEAQFWWWADQQRSVMITLTSEPPQQSDDPLRTNIVAHISTIKQSFETTNLCLANSRKKKTFLIVPRS